MVDPVDYIRDRVTIGARVRRAVCKLDMSKLAEKLCRHICNDQAIRATLEAEKSRSIPQ